VDGIMVVPLQATVRARVAHLAAGPEHRLGMMAIESSRPCAPSSVMSPKPVVESVAT
jgi:hypothetical protein